MHIFFSSLLNNNEVILSPEESGHAIRVLRLQKGEKVQIIDGKGNLFEATITLPDARQCQLEITGTLPLPQARNFNLHIAISPTKQIDRFEWFVEKAVEIGIDTITPLLCQRSERRVIKTERLHKLIISTMKQAMVTKLPVMNELTGYNHLIKTCSGPLMNRFIAHCSGSERKPLKQALVTGNDVVILIGPEGDFSAEEVELALAQSFIPVSLGHNRLRTETAGIAACHTANLMNGLV